MPLSLRLYHSGVSGMKSMFDKKVEDHKKTQLDNPFSEWEGAGHNQRRLSKDDEYYGRPLPGSKSEKRAQAAQHHVMMDIKYLCDMIWDCAEWKSPDGRAAITFGKLFSLYNAVSDKVVGTLLRARKHGFLHFEGEMLYQRRDEEKVIELSRNINTIRKRFGSPPILTGGGEAEPWSSDEKHVVEGRGRRNSTPTGVSTLPTIKIQRRSSMHDKPCGGSLLNGVKDVGGELGEALMEESEESVDCDDDKVSECSERVKEVDREIMKEEEKSLQKKNVEMSEQCNREILEPGPSKNVEQTIVDESVNRSIEKSQKIRNESSLENGSETRGKSSVDETDKKDDVDERNERIDPEADYWLLSERVEGEDEVLNDTGLTLCKKTKKVVCQELQFGHVNYS